MISKNNPPNVRKGSTLSKDIFGFVSFIKAADRFFVDYLSDFLFFSVAIRRTIFVEGEITNSILSIQLLNGAR